MDLIYNILLSVAISGLTGIIIYMNEPKKELNPLI
jgi:hypothetical protein